MFPGMILRILLCSCERSRFARYKHVLGQASVPFPSLHIIHQLCCLQKVAGRTVNDDAHHDPGGLSTFLQPCPPPLFRNRAPPPHPATPLLRHNILCAHVYRFRDGRTQGSSLASHRCRFSPFTSCLSPCRPSSAPRDARAGGPQRHRLLLLLLLLARRRWLRRICPPLVIAEAAIFLDRQGRCPRPVLQILLCRMGGLRGVVGMLLVPALSLVPCLRTCSMHFCPTIPLSTLR